MALLRIRNPEQLKAHAPGELGLLLGLDRAPERKTLRLEKNKRSANVEFKAPEGTWITQAQIRKEKKHYGGHDKIEYSVSTVNGEKRKTSAKVSLWCNPPNYPGAPGGWMKVTLYGKRTATPVSGAEQ